MRKSSVIAGHSILLFTLLFSAGCSRETPAPVADTKSPPAPALSAAPSASVAASAVAHSDHHAAPPWFDGSPEQAFARAKQDGSLIFLYWGAAWCPPCNELKSQVFNKHQFADLVRGFVPVYLDGDTDDAQRLGETFNISGYPTVIILSSEKEELLRLGGSLDAEEFERALAGVKAKGETFRTAVERTESKKPTDADCNLLAHTAWELLPEDQWPPQKVMTILRGAVDACPAKLERERSLLASTLIGMASVGSDNASNKTIVDELKSKISTYFDIMFANADTAWAARALVNNRAGDVAQWIEGKKPTPLATDWKVKWLEAAKRIREHKDASVDTRLSSYAPLLEFEEHLNPDKPISDETKKILVAAAEQADKDAKTPYERHAVVTSIAFIFRKAGEPDRAKALLLAEADKTDTPFYYYSSLAAQEKALGHMDEARRWSRKARESSAGRATRLQWIAQDVQMNAKPNGPEERKYLLGLVDEFYTLALSLDDGFLGRNRMRATTVRKALDGLSGDDAKELFAKHKAACEKLTAAKLEACKKHFE